MGDIGLTCSCLAQAVMDYEKDRSEMAYFMPRCLQPPSPYGCKLASLQEPHEHDAIQGHVVPPSPSPASYHWQRRHAASMATTVT